MPNFTPRASPLFLYIHITYNVYIYIYIRIYMTSRLYTHAHIDTCMYIYRWRAVWWENARRSKKGGNYMYGVNEMRGAQSTSVRIYTHARIYVWNCSNPYLNNLIEWWVSGPLGVVYCEGPRPDPAVRNMCSWRTSRARGNWLQRKISPKLY